MSRVTQMAFLGTSAASPATLAFQAFTTHTTEAQTVTFTAVGIGTAAADRYVFITIPYYNGGTSNISISSVTISGVLATIHSQPFLATTPRGGCAIVSALVPTGTTADVVITWASSGAGYYRPRIAVYRVTGLQSTVPFNLITDTTVVVSSSRTFTVNTTKGGFVLLGAFLRADAKTMTGLATDFNVSPVANFLYIGGGSTVSNAGTLSATIAGGTSTNWCVVMACFR